MTLRSFSLSTALALVTLAASAGVDAPGPLPAALRPPLVLAMCYQHRLPTDAGGLERVSMQLADTLRAREAPLVAERVTDSFMTSLGVCDRRTGGASGAAQCRIYQMCSRLDAMDPETQFIRPGTVRRVAVAQAAPISGVASPAATPAATHLALATP